MGNHGHVGVNSLGGNVVRLYLQLRGLARGRLLFREDADLRDVLAPLGVLPVLP